MKCRSNTWLLGLIFSGTAAATTSAQTHIYEGRCHQGYCSWFTIELVELVKSGPSGSLKRVTSKEWWDLKAADKPRASTAVTTTWYV